MPDAPGLELIAQELNKTREGTVIETAFERGRATLVVSPEGVIPALRWLRDTDGQEYRFLSSLHAADYLPNQPRFAIHYELINRNRVERIRVKAMLDAPRPAGPVTAGNPPPTAPPAGEALPEIDSCVELFPTANAQEREVYDFFGIVFRGHPNLTRILMPDDYVGWPQRRDFPVGGEPVAFTVHERDAAWYEQ